AHYNTTKSVGEVSSVVSKSEVIVRWRPPSESWVKLNMDDSCKDGNKAILKV
ncbi:hypothetical protein A2U01_0114808, partial [Trifolium medium]|nr:hypothetical protein [Trifolium medium]